MFDMIIALMNAYVKAREENRKLKEENDKLKKYIRELEQYK